MGFFDDLSNIVFLLQDVLGTVLFIYLGIRSFSRKWYLSEAAEQTTHFYTRRLKTKIFLNLLICIYYVLVFVYLLFLAKTETVLDSLKYMVFFPLAALILESDLLLFQYRRRISSAFGIHGLTWICLNLCSIATLFAYLSLHDRITEYHITNILLSLSQVLLFLLRAGVQLSFPQDKEHLSYTSLEEQLLSSVRANKIEVCTLGFEDSESSVSRSAIGERPKKLASGFSISVKSAKKVNGQYLFQVSISSSQKTSKIFKTYPEFAELHELLRNHTKKTLELPKLGKLNESSIPQAIMLLQKYIDNILNTFDPIPDDVLHFLKIVPEDKSREQFLDVTAGKPKQTKKVGVSSTIARNLSVPQLQSSRISAGEVDSEGDDFQRQSTSGMEKDFCHYITVTLTDASIPSGSTYCEYSFNLALSDFPEESWLITKRYKEFTQLVDALSQKKIKLPKLPPGRLMQSRKVVEERKIALANFLRVLLNEELYLGCEEVASFASLPKDIQKLFSLHNDRHDFSHWSVRFIENKVKILPNNIAVTEFVILVHTKSLEGDGTCYKIYKRMLDFENLYSALAIRFGKELLPQLPAKFNAFFTQTSVEFRMIGLENFLNALFKVPNIGDCFAFRKFLNMTLNEIQGRKSNPAVELPGSDNKTFYQTNHPELIPEESRLSLQSQTDKLTTIHQLRQKNF